MIIEGYITIDNEYDNMPRINNESICSYLEKLITNERYHKGINTGYVKWKDKGLGEKHYYLKDCKVWYNGAIYEINHNKRRGIGSMDAWRTWKEFEIPENEIHALQN